MNFDHYDFDICQVFLPYIVNGDGSGLNGNEIVQIDDFISKLHPNLMWEIGNESFFGEDEISGLYADCVKCEAHFQID